MTDDELQEIAERHLDGQPPRPGDGQAYEALDLVVWELQMLRNDSGPELPPRTRRGNPTVLSNECSNSGQPSSTLRRTAS